MRSIDLELIRRFFMNLGSYRARSQFLLIHMYLPSMVALEYSKVQTSDAMMRGDPCGEALSFFFFLSESDFYKSHLLVFLPLSNFSFLFSLLSCLEVWGLLIVLLTEDLEKRVLSSNLHSSENNAQSTSSK